MLGKLRCELNDPLGKGGLIKTHLSSCAQPMAEVEAAYGDDHYGSGATALGLACSFGV
jgi:hypothetical protein